jgi:hypothetical protein
MMLQAMGAGKKLLAWQKTLQHFRQRAESRKQIVKAKWKMESEETSVSG